MRPASRWLRRAEITLFALGVSLLGVALGATAHRQNFQAEQERVLEARMAAAIQQLSEPAPHAGSGDGRLAPADDPVVNAAASSPANPTELSFETAPLAGATASDKDAAVLRSEKTRDTDLATSSDLLGRIEIQRIGLSAIVVAADDDASLGRAVGWVSGTAAPGEGGNTALAGHRDTHFRPLQDIRVDDRISFVVPPHTYEYRVDSLRVVRPTEVSVLESNGTEELTLVTCYPFRWVGPAPDRFIVKATRIR